jgi:hypothetical protein
MNPDAVIPAKNPKALFGYYCAIFSLIPCLGLPLGFTGLTLGVLGLKAVKEKPELKGTVHAWIGIVLGGLMGLLNLLVVLAMLFGATLAATK